MSKKRRIQACWPNEEKQGCSQQPAPRTLAHTLLRREQGLLAPQICARLCTLRSFAQFGCQSSFDTHNEEALPYMPLEFMHRRASISEIIVSGQYLFALASNGLCSVFNVDCPSKRLCYINSNEGDVIRSLFLNKQQGALIAVSGHARDDFGSLHCRSIPVHEFAQAKPGAHGSAPRYWQGGIPIFTSDNLRAPGGFVEFDDSTWKALAFDAASQIFKVYSLSNYKLLYTLSSSSAGNAATPDVISATDVKMSWSVLLAVGHVAGAKLPLSVLSLQSGQVLARQQLAVQPSEPLDMLELFDSKLLIKQVLQPLRIYDVLSLQLLAISNHEFLSSTATFLYCHGSNVFLTVTGTQVAAWNFKAQMVATYEDCVLWLPDMHNDLMYLAISLDLIICYCKPSNCEAILPESSAVGSINISSVSSGRCIAKLEAWDDVDRRAALADVTAVLYDEADHAIYVGTHHGVVHKWSNATAG